MKPKGDRPKLHSIRCRENDKQCHRHNKQGLFHDVPLRVNERSRYQYLPTDRAAEIIFELVKRRKWGEVFNVCGKGTVSLKEVRLSLKKSLRYLKKCAPAEKYEINNEKISRFFDLPESREVAMEFIKAETKENKKLSDK